MTFRAGNRFRRESSRRKSPFGESPSSPTLVFYFRWWYFSLRVVSMLRRCWKWNRPILTMSNLILDRSSLVTMQDLYGLLVI